MASKTVSAFYQKLLGSLQSSNTVLELYQKNHSPNERKQFLNELKQDISINETFDLHSKEYYDHSLISNSLLDHYYPLLKRLEYYDSSIDPKEVILLSHLSARSKEYDLLKSKYLPTYVARFDLPKSTKANATDFRGFNFLNVKTRSEFVRDLHDKLIAGGYISKISYRDFSIFFNYSYKAPKTYITWRADAYLLRHFIIKINKSTKMSFKKPFWNDALLIFRDTKCKPFKAIKTNTFLKKKKSKNTILIGKLDSIITDLF